MSGDELEVVSVENPTDEVVEDKTIKKTGPDLLIKHPLQHKWALWYFKNDRAKDWNENLKVVAKFKFVEDFWA